MSRSVTIVIASLMVTGLLVFGCSGQNDSNSRNRDSDPEYKEGVVYQSYIEFDTITHDFGTLIEGEQVVCYFDYTNSGNGELVIQSVESSCGCTVPGWSGKPLKPGERASVEVTFDSEGRNGEQTKVITINSNAENREVRLKIKANIVANNN